MGQKGTGLALGAGAESVELPHSCLYSMAGSRLGHCSLCLGPKGIVGFVGKDGAATEKVPFLHLMGQELAEHTLPGEGVEGSGAEVVRGAKSVGGELELEGQGSGGEAEEAFQPWPPTIKMGKAFKGPFLNFVL